MSNERGDSSCFIWIVCGCVRVKTFHIQSDVKVEDTLTSVSCVCAAQTKQTVQISQHPPPWVSMSLSDVYVHFVC